jgi:mono/diheme cytochrome c family protein
MCVTQFAIATVVVSSIIAATITARAAERSKENYLMRCASCHGVEGRGDGPSLKWLLTRPTDFRDCGDMRKLSDDTMFTVIKYGTGAVDLPPDMPGFWNRLSDDEIKNVVSFVRQFCPK